MKTWHLHAYYLTLIAFIIGFNLSGPIEKESKQAPRAARSIASINKVILGTTEMVVIDDFELKAKVDSGADTSSLHAFDIEPFIENEVHFVRFKTEDDKGKVHELVRKVTKQDNVKSASGTTLRYYVEETVNIGNNSYIIDVTLADRSHLSKKFLIGKNILQHYLIDVSQEE